MISGPKGPVFELTEEESSVLNMASSSAFYSNCKRQRERGAKICGDCPFIHMVEWAERNNEKLKGEDNGRS